MLFLANFLPCSNRVRRVAFTHFCVSRPTWVSLQYCRLTHFMELTLGIGQTSSSATTSHDTHSLPLDLPSISPCPPPFLSPSSPSISTTAVAQRQRTDREVNARLATTVPQPAELLNPRPLHSPPPAHMPTPPRTPLPSSTLSKRCLGQRRRRQRERAIQGQTLRLSIQSPLSIRRTVSKSGQTRCRRRQREHVAGVAHEQVSLIYISIVRLR